MAKKKPEAPEEPRKLGTTRAGGRPVPSNTQGLNPGTDAFGKAYPDAYGRILGETTVIPKNKRLRGVPKEVPQKLQEIGLTRENLNIIRYSFPRTQPEGVDVWRPTGSGELTDEEIQAGFKCLAKEDDILR